MRYALAKPDTITASAAAAREEIGRAVAARIRDTQSASELKKVAEDVLPQIEKFLESPEEKRLRRMRTGTTILSVGLGVAISFLLIGVLVKEDLLVLSALGLVTFFIGLGFIVNGLLMSLPERTLPGREIAGAYNKLEAMADLPPVQLADPPVTAGFTSVTEDTTRHLKRSDRQASE
ncbi:MAG: hypothetical protein ABI539_13760 [Acidobacteriota bacterium]